MFWKIRGVEGALKLLSYLLVGANSVKVWLVLARRPAKFVALTTAARELCRNHHSQKLG